MRHAKESWLSNIFFWLVITSRRRRRQKTRNDSHQPVKICLILVWRLSSFFLHCHCSFGCSWADEDGPAWRECHNIWSMIHTSPVHHFPFGCVWARNMFPFDTQTYDMRQSTSLSHKLRPGSRVTQHQDTSRVHIPENKMFLESFPIVENHFVGKKASIRFKVNLNISFSHLWRAHKETRTRTKDVWWATNGNGDRSRRPGVQRKWIFRFYCFHYISSWLWLGWIWLEPSLWKEIFSAIPAPRFFRPRRFLMAR